MSDFSAGVLAGAERGSQADVPAQNLPDAPTLVGIASPDAAPVADRSRHVRSAPDHRVRPRQGDRRQRGRCGLRVAKRCPWRVRPDLGGGRMGEGRLHDDARPGGLRAFPAAGVRSRGAATATATATAGTGTGTVTAATSDNWAGYAAAGTAGTYTSVSSNWVRAERQLRQRGHVLQLLGRPRRRRHRLGGADRHRGRLLRRPGAVLGLVRDVPGRPGDLRRPDASPATP